MNEKIVNDYKTFVINNLASTKPVIPTVQVVARYGERDSELKTSVIKAVLANSKLSANFLGYAYDENDVEKIIDFFEMI